MKKVYLLFITMVMVLSLTSCTKDEKTTSANTSGKVEFQLNADKGERTLLLIRKDGDTPAKYPRKAGTPSRQPL